MSLNAMSVKLLNHPECNKPTNMLIWGIAPGTYRDEVYHIYTHPHHHITPFATTWTVRVHTPATASQRMCHI